MAGVFEPLQKYLLRRAPRGIADDLLADVLLIVWRRLDEVPTSNPLPWCYAVARNVLGNSRRSETRRLRLVEKLESDPTTHRHLEGPGEGDPELQQAMEELSEADRELVRLWAWEQLEPREIAIVLETTANAVSLRLGRIKQKVSDSIERQNRERSGHIPGVSPEEHVGEM